MLLWTKKNQHYNIKICRLQIRKKRSTLDGNLNIHYIWQNKAVNFLLIFKGQYLIIVLALVIFDCFEATCLIIFPYLQYLGSFQLIELFFVSMTKLMKESYFLLQTFYLSCEYHNFCTESVYLETRLVVTKTTRAFVEPCSI